MEEEKKRKGEEKERAKKASQASLKARGTHTTSAGSGLLPSGPSQVLCLILHGSIYDLSNVPRVT